MFLLLALCCRTFHDHCLVFVQTKKEAHRLHVILGLLGLNVGELHGNLKQPKVSTSKKTKNHKNNSG